MSDAPSKSDPENYLAAKSTRIRISDLSEAKRRGQKWTALTSYDSISAKIFDIAKIPCLLVGDSGSQVMLGHKSTLTVTMDEMIILVKAVTATCERALVIADLPFGSYQESPQLALKNAIRFMKEAHAHGVKLEGGIEYVEHVRLLTRAGIPVMAHIGLTPQCEHQLSGFKVQGRDEVAKKRIVSDAIALQDAGAFACVIELVPSDVGKLVTEQLHIPTIGIGAGPHTDAQILVWTDMCGFTAPKGKISTSYLSDTGGANLSETTKSQSSSTLEKDNTTLELNRVPKFVKKYANMSEIIYNAAIAFAKDVRSGTYPAEEHCYN